MKFNYFIIPIVVSTLFSCSRSTNTQEFIEKTAGRYLYNSDEVVEVYFNNNILFMKWRGASNITPLKVNDSTFFVKEMNEKIQFSTNPKDRSDYMVLVPKEEDKLRKYNYRKLQEDEFIPREYLKKGNYEEALKAYLVIKKKDSLDNAVNEEDLNSRGYDALREKNYEKAIDIFKINMALRPASANVYDSLADAYKRSGDTVKAILNYKKSLQLDSGNTRAKRFLKKYDIENK